MRGEERRKGKRKREGGEKRRGGRREKISGAQVSWKNTTTGLLAGYSGKSLKTSGKGKLPTAQKFKP